MGDGSLSFICVLLTNMKYNSQQVYAVSFFTLLITLLVVQLSNMNHYFYGDHHATHSVTTHWFAKLIVFRELNV